MPAASTSAEPPPPRCAPTGRVTTSTDARPPAVAPPCDLHARGLEITPEGEATRFWPYGELRQTQGSYAGEEVRLERGGELPEVLVVADSAFLADLHEISQGAERALPRPAGPKPAPAAHRAGGAGGGGRGGRRVSLGHSARRGGGRRARAHRLGGEPRPVRGRQPGQAREALRLRGRAAGPRRAGRDAGRGGSAFRLHVSRPGRGPQGP